MTLLYVGVSVVPLVQVASRLSFGLKISGLVAVTNLLGLILYRAARRRQAEPEGRSPA